MTSLFHIQWFQGKSGRVSIYQYQKYLMTAGTNAINPFCVVPHHRKAGAALEADQDGL